MSILLVLIPVTLLFIIVGGIAFFWAVNHDQFDDMDTPALQPLADGDLADGEAVADGEPVADSEAVAAAGVATGNGTQPARATGPGGGPHLEREVSRDVSR